MRLAVENMIEIGRQRITLRPTLRAAIRLERQHGFKALVAGIAEGSLSLMSDVIRESTNTETFDPDLLLEVGPAGLGVTVEALAEPLLAHVLDLYGIDPTKPSPEQPRPKKATETPAGAFAELFAIGTGVLGWSPEHAGAASPAEIIAARDGRTRFLGDLLRAVFGSKDNASAPEPSFDPLDAELDRDGLAELRRLAG